MYEMDDGNRECGFDCKLMGFGSSCFFFFFFFSFFSLFFIFIFFYLFFLCLFKMSGGQACSNLVLHSELHKRSCGPRCFLERQVRWGHFFNKTTLLRCWEQ